MYTVKFRNYEYGNNDTPQEYNRIIDDTVMKSLVKMINPIIALTEAYRHFFVHIGGQETTVPVLL